MIKIEKIVIEGWEASIRGMRNPFNSWDKSDSFRCLEDCIHDKCLNHNRCVGDFFVGSNDLALMKRLSKAGSDHSKFLRMINVTCDITAPLYWWKEYDTYKVGTVANSCSTMHKVHEKEFTVDDFSHEHLSDDSLAFLEDTIYHLNHCRDGHLIAKREGLSDTAKHYWWQMIQLLPTSYNQKRTVQLNYQVLKNIYFARRNHKLTEWHTLCEWIEELPYFKEVCIDGNT